MASKSICLVYFDGRGRAEPARWLLAQAGVKYEDKRVTGEEWQSMKSKAPYGELPVLKSGDCCLAQSGAICHYIAQEHGLNGCNAWEAAEIHMIWDSICDAFNAGVKAAFCKDPEEQKRLGKVYTEEALPKLLCFLKKRLEGGKQFLVGNKCSAADIYAACYLHDQPSDCCEKVKQCKEVADLVKRVTEQPKIKEWISCRPKTKF